MQQYHSKTRILKLNGNMRSDAILNKIVSLFFITKFSEKTRSPPHIDLILKIQIGGREDGF